MKNTWETAQFIIRELNGLKIHNSVVGEIFVLDSFKKIPRTGKAVRIDQHGLNLPKQTLFDHINSLARLSDCLMEAFDLQLDREKVARMAVFHDLAEVICGDVPDFTASSLAGQHFKTAEEKHLSEQQANLVIAEKMPADLKFIFWESIEEVEAQATVESRFFKMLDKMEPITAVWRYIKQFRAVINIEDFMKAMADFF